MKKHRQIFFLVRNFDLKIIEEQTHFGFKTLFKRLKDLGYVTRKETDTLHPNSTIGTIDLDKRYLSISDTVLIGYMFSSSFSDKTLLSLTTVLDHFDVLVINEDSDLLDQLYRQAKIDKVKKYKEKEHEKK